MQRVREWLITARRHDTTRSRVQCNIICSSHRARRRQICSVSTWNQGYQANDIRVRLLCTENRRIHPEGLAHHREAGGFVRPCSFGAGKTLEMENNTESLVLFPVVEDKVNIDRHGLEDAVRHLRFKATDRTSALPICARSLFGGVRHRPLSQTPFGTFTA